MTTSCGFIEGGFGSGFPFYYNDLENNYAINYYESVNGTADSTSYYEVYRNQFVAAWAGSDYGWISVGVPLGAIPGDGTSAPVAIATALSIFGTISSIVDFSLPWVQFDGPCGSTVHLYDDVGTSLCVLSNDQNGYVPLLGVYIGT